MANLLTDIRWFPLPLRSILGSTINNPALFFKIGDPLEDQVRLIKFDNLTDKNIFISTSAASTGIFTIIAAGSFFLLDISTNQTGINGLFIDAGTQFYASSASTPSTGSLYITSISSTGGP